MSSKIFAFILLVMCPVLPSCNATSSHRPSFFDKYTSDIAVPLESRTLGYDQTECSPGLSVDATGNCTCAASKYWGIVKCNMTLERAYVTHGFWVGYCNRNDSTQGICTGHCPLGFCAYNDTKTKGLHLLPAEASKLDDFICGPTRTGTLCGKCRTNYSVYYHSWSYNCGPNHKCHLGLLFYILSELLPLMILFIIIIVFNVSFTSGATTGFILFAQVLDSLSLDANGVIQFPRAVSVLTSAQRLLYRLFNLEFFSIEQLSFCLWEGATVLNAMVMKYVTIIFALGLVLCVVLVMKVCKCHCQRLSHQTLKNAVVHGLSAFFVMCYAQCCRVSFQILCPMCVHAEGLACIREVVYRSGDLKSFHGEHLKYAVPAVVLLVLLSILPVLLIAYPLSCRVLGFCNLSESRLVNRLTRLIPIPLLDSFQSSFKDNFRFFAGLYFLYRMFALAAYAYAVTITQFYTIVELQIILILAIHSMAQPYRTRWHNIVDTLIFANLAIINGLTMFNYAKVTEGKDEEVSIEKTISITSSVQLILSCLPLVYMISYVTYHLLSKLRKLIGNCKRRSSVTSDLRNYDSLPPLRDPLLEPGAFAGSYTFQNAN